MRFLCVLLFLHFYAGISSRCGVTSKEMVTCLLHPYPYPGSEEGRVPPSRELEGCYKTLQGGLVWILASLESHCDEEGVSVLKDRGSRLLKGRIIMVQDGAGTAFTVTEQQRWFKLRTHLSVSV